ncbi:MAG: hypothetical protein HRT93_03210 [Piscirickettsiaceae bacterium]|nr:hypothetical protein [Piscirickettsiaceae bacterium]
MRSEKIDKRIVQHIRSRYTMVDVIAKRGLFNQRCHQNAVQFASENKGYGVAEVIYIDGGTPILHYVNTRAGRFYETTLGFEASDLEYYKIRDINPSDHQNIVGEFRRSLEGWRNEYTNWFTRLYVDRVV